MIAAAGFFAEYGPEMLQRTREHMVLTLVAMLVACIVSVPLGIVLARSRLKALVTVVMGLVNLIQPIPSLALVALTVVVFYRINQLFGTQALDTLGTQPGLVALVAYALLPILRNTYTGIRQVDPVIVEVATGMGMTQRQILLSVQMPLAMPVIMAGVRISTVWTIGVATLVSLVGAGGLGDLIFRGLSTFRINLILAGAAPAALLALLFDWLLARLETWLSPGGGATRTTRAGPVRGRLLKPAVAVLLLCAGLAALYGGIRRSLSDRDGHLTAGFTAEFMERNDGYKGLVNAYDFEFAEQPKQMDPGLMYKACADGSVDIICAFATDGRIAAYDLVTLEDDKSFFPPYHAAPVVRGDTLSKHPELARLLNRLGGKLDDTTMQRLNLQVDREENPRKASSVARDFLVSAGLIGAHAKPGDGSAGVIRIGGKDFTEQNILGEILAIVIECSTDIAVERRLYLGGTMICFNALKSGDLDLYVEYTGTGLMDILDGDMLSNPDAVYAAVKKAFKDKWNLVWLEPLGFNNTYTLTVRKKLADRLALSTFSDLSAHLDDGARE